MGIWRFEVFLNKNVKNKTQQSRVHTEIETTEKNQVWWGNDEFCLDMFSSMDLLGLWNGRVLHAVGPEF